MTGIFIQQLNRYKTMDCKLMDMSSSIDDLKTLLTTDGSEIVIVLYIHIEKIPKVEGYPYPNILSDRFRLIQVLKIAWSI